MAGKNEANGNESGLQRANDTGAPITEKSISSVTKLIESIGKDMEGLKDAMKKGYEEEFNSRKKNSLAAIEKIENQLGGEAVPGRK